jgi:predicted DNA-binding protein (UPF0251 family)
MRKKRFCRPFNGAYFFKPRGVRLTENEIIVLELDELEAVHLCDHEELSQIDAAQRMNISDSTLQRLLYAGRKKMAEAIYSGKALRINTPESVQFMRNCFGRGVGRCGSGR